MALNALWPLIANAAPQSVSIVFELCSVKSGKVVQVGELPLPAPAEQHQGPHCPFCASGAGGAPLISAPLLIFVPFVPASGGVRASEYLHSGSVAHLHAPPRGPPVLI